MHTVTHTFASEFAAVAVVGRCGVMMTRFQFRLAFRARSSFSCHSPPTPSPLARPEEPQPDHYARGDDVATRATASELYNLAA